MKSRWWKWGHLDYMCTGNIRSQSNEENRFHNNFILKKTRMTFSYFVSYPVQCHPPNFNFFESLYKCIKWKNMNFSSKIWKVIFFCPVKGRKFWKKHRKRFIFSSLHCTVPIWKAKYLAERMVVSLKSTKFIFSMILFSAGKRSKISRPVFVKFCGTFFYFRNQNHSRQPLCTVTVVT